MTKDILSTIKATAVKRQDEFGQRILGRVEGINDLVAAEGRYHHDCDLNFRFKEEGEPLGKRGRRIDVRKQEAFDKLCHYLTENDDCQYSLHELQSQMESNLEEGEEPYTQKWLKEQVLSHFGERITITEIQGRSAFVSLRDTSYKILYDTWYKEKKINEKYE